MMRVLSGKWLAPPTNSAKTLGVALGRRIRFGLSSHVPLAGEKRVVTAVLEHLRDRQRVVRESRLGPASDRRQVMVGATEQLRSGRVADSRRMEVRHDDARGGECIEIGRGDLATHVAGIRVSHVVGHDEENVGPLLPCFGSNRIIARTCTHAPGKQEAEGGSAVRHARRDYCQAHLHQWIQAASTPFYRSIV